MGSYGCLKSYISSVALPAQLVVQYHLKSPNIAKYYPLLLHSDIFQYCQIMTNIVGYQLMLSCIDQCCPVGFGHFAITAIKLTELV